MSGIVFLILFSDFLLLLYKNIIDFFFTVVKYIILTSLFLIFICSFVYFWVRRGACGIIVPQPRVEPRHGNETTRT